MKRSEALQPLSHDHHKGLQFAARLRTSLRTGDDVAGLPAEVAAFWRDHLVPHFADEEAFVLPVLRGGASLLADRMVEEHEAIEALVRTVETAHDDPPLAAFAEALVAHIRFEEREAFPAAERLADEETLARIGEQVGGSNPPPASLSLPPDEMRRLGYRVIDMIVDHIETLPERPVSNVASWSSTPSSQWKAWDITPFPLAASASTKSMRWSEWGVLP